MLKNYSYLFALLFVFIFTSQSSYAQYTPRAEFSKEYLKANLRVLSSDEFEGREATTRGAKLTSLFISGELQKYGVKPFGDDGTYFQNFDVNVEGIDTTSGIELLDENFNEIDKFYYAKDFVRSTYKFPAVKIFDNSLDVVFARYGITADEYNYNDYKNLDVKGKVVLVLAGEPASDDPNFFEGETETTYSRTSSKLAAAKSNGAAAVLVLADDNFKENWDGYVGWSKRLHFSLPAEEKEKNESDNIPVFGAGSKMGIKLFAGEKYSYGELIGLKDTVNSLQTFQLKKKLNFGLKSEKGVRQARNVIGILEGTDPGLKDEYVVVSAHLDHLGKHDGKIWNGADDDGSGTATVLEVARTMSKIHKNRRSILFVFHTAEEKGLFGSKYLTSHVDYIDKIAADVNIDMVGRESVDSIDCIGSRKLSDEFGDLVKDVNDATVEFNLNYRFDDPADPNRFYYRSDHYNYAKHGIPIVFFFDYMKKDYHKPTDTYEKIDFEKMLKTAVLAHNIALKTANLDHKVVVDKKEEMSH